MTKDMTSGNPMKLIVGFALPMMMGLLFQQLYSMVDTLIVGRYLGVEALAAVGSTGSVNFMVIGFCMGVCNGFAIPVAHKFGAGDYRGMRKTVANCVWLGIVFAVVMTALTTFFCRTILEVMRTPDNILEQACSYIFIIFMGIPATLLYNTLSGIIRALGDSKTPLVFLVFSSILNVVLDLFFMVSLKMGVAGAAWATVISQAVSGIFCLIFVIRKMEILHIQKDEWAPDKQTIANLCNMGIPMGLQYSVTAIGSVILQSAVNTLGSDAVAAVAAATKIHCFMACPMDALGSTMATYGGQNIGARKVERVGAGLKSALLLGAGYSLIAFAAAVFFGSELAGLFVDKTAAASIVKNVRLFLVANTAFYFPLAIVNIVRFLIQGIGYPKFAILSGAFEMAARALTGFVLVPLFGFRGACMGSPIAWLLADAFLFPAFFHVYKKTKMRLSAA